MTLSVVESDPAKELATEIELLRRVGRGIAEALRSFTIAFSGVFSGSPSRMLKKSEAAERFMQDVFIRCWKKAPLFDATRGRPMTWAVTLTRAIARLT